MISLPNEGPLPRHHIDAIVPAVILKEYLCGKNSSLLHLHEANEVLRIEDCKRHFWVVSRSYVELSKSNLGEGNRDMDHCDVMIAT